MCKYRSVKEYFWIEFLSTIQKKIIYRLDKILENEMEIEMVIFYSAHTFKRYRFHLGYDIGLTRDISYAL